ncbi:MAG: hypothetical protein JRJ77_13895, partial [Deltaproteobacteria bacterium]|nr:hypothetical protein [Deltaproteobacteria bacterium]
ILLGIAVFILVIIEIIKIFSDDKGIRLGDEMAGTRVSKNSLGLAGALEKLSLVLRFANTVTYFDQWNWRKRSLSTKS